MIKSIFYSRFHPEKGSRVLHQVPEGSITPSKYTRHRQPLFRYSSISEFIIPKQDFCDRLFTICVSHYRVIGYPVCINDYSGKYERNQFIFNFALVIDEELDDWGSYASVVRKLGRLLRALEEQGGFLSREEDPSWFEDDDEEDVRGSRSNGHQDIPSMDSLSLSTDHESEKNVSGEQKSGGNNILPPQARMSCSKGASSKVYAICEMILEDLNNYYECMIPIDDSNTINLKLFPTRPPPAPVYAWHVPLLTINLSAFSSRNLSSDLTLQRIVPFVNGTTSVAQISRLADTDLGLTRKAVQHLVYYGCVILLDIFQFGAIYAPTAEISSFVVDESMQEECARYVRTPKPVFGPGSVASTETATTEIPPASNSAYAYDMAGTHQQQPYRWQQQDQHHPQQSSRPEIIPEITGDLLVKLYTSLKQGVTLRNWCLENLEVLGAIDVRRLVTFGVIKGFLYRVHKYAIATSSSLTSPNRAELAAGVGAQDDVQEAFKASNKIGAAAAAAATNNTAATAGASTAAAAAAAAAAEDERVNSSSTPPAKVTRELPLEKYLDGMHSFDEICTELLMNERDVLGKMKGFGEVQIICR